MKQGRLFVFPVKILKLKIELITERALVIDVLLIFFFNLISELEYVQ